MPGGACAAASRRVSAVAWLGRESNRAAKSGAPVAKEMKALREVAFAGHWTAKLSRRQGLLRALSERLAWDLPCSDLP